MRLKRALEARVSGSGVPALSVAVHGARLLLVLLAVTVYPETALQAAKTETRCGPRALDLAADL